MPRNFNLSGKLPGAPFRNLKDPRIVARTMLIVLAVANLVAALIVFKPWGGSAEDLAREQQELQQRLMAMQAQLGKAKSLVTKAQRARQEGDTFLTQYTTDRRTTFSILFAELDRIAKEAGIVTKPVALELDQVEGSDTLSQLSITAAYEGNYAALTKYINLVDRSPNFLIVESLVATPQQTNGSDLLNISIKLDTFVREETGPLPLSGPHHNIDKKPAPQEEESES